ncbi:guanine nucleotide exchange protein smcr8b [Danio rerio]|uniref:Guanine nucleotide exchange protein smcr8b n=2 Tax=Danio rerio TaxID=7955 RepID=SMR8B_DANRE|nr:guanine nucleotide exchange protein smcr8b [Danio rerio]Q6PUR7.1 RecName: Full=Guanine nucleotide exchange protein smcr8b; AltName: Full=Smith-Magenis syndrome chromosomal region candidate gene 8 protein homolog B [Danio rerio]AAI62340.1 Smith-Magenis syndrome chromosome region, candidate 8b [Danio rerio]AAS92636.1 Smith-Magenis syndrome chromosome region, candidate 8 [Danio rerio]|eukprot:NP_999967.1 guanine nucleotide exchange protein smcr8b [Danio rerio]
MIGSPDLVAFTKETDFSEITTDSSVLPEDLSVPMYPYTGDATPWSKISSAKLKKDFILISEFSEQVGPQPLLTVPLETKACGTFDLNYFSLRIMSVDYQTSLAGSPGYGSFKLNFVEDSKVVLADSREGVFAYVHHLTLYDLEARGFVRPLCLAYVSSDENKIIQQFQRISTEFNKVSECLKTGNRKNFANELEVKLRDLEYTRVVLQKELNTVSVKCSSEREPILNGVHSFERNADEVKLNEKSSHTDEISPQEKDGCGNSRKVEVKLENENRSHFEHEQYGKQRKDKPDKTSCPMPLANKNDELASVEKLIQDYKSLLKQVTCYPTRKLRDSEYSPYEPDDLPQSFDLDLDSQFAGPMLECSVFTYTNTPSQTLQQINSTSSSRFDKRLKTLEELCDDYFYQQALQQLYSIERTFRGDACYLYTQQLCRNLLRNLKSTNFLFEDPCDLDDDVGLQIGQSTIQQPSFLPAPSFLSGPVSLESYASCVEMVPIKLELGGSSQSQVQHSTLNTPSKDNRPQVADKSPAEVEMKGEIISAPDCQGNVESVSNLMKTSISSGDSIEVLGTERSFRSQGANTLVETAMHRPPPLSSATALEGLKQGRVPTRRTCSEDSIEVLCITESISPDELRASYPCAIDEESPEQETDEKNSSQYQEDNNEKSIYVQGKISADHENACLKKLHPSVTVTPPDCPLTLEETSFQDSCQATESATMLLLDEPSRMVPDDLSDCFSYRSTTASTTSECTFPACLPKDKREGGTRRRRGRVGRAALQFMRQFPFAVHAVFSLLSGRTLVVLGSEEAAVRRLVTALSVYLPHLTKYKDSIQPWTSTPLQLTDLLNWKLIGFDRMCSFNPSSLPHCLDHYSRYLSILDVDQKTLHCPTYSGSLINLLVEPKSHFKRGNTYFTFAQSVQSKLVTKAFLLTFSHGHPSPSRPQGSSGTECFLSELHTDDKKILRYLSELIKLHFMEVTPNVLLFSYTTTSIFKL